jgi:hypothetical protein
MDNGKAQKDCLWVPTASTRSQASCSDAEIKSFHVLTYDANTLSETGTKSAAGQNLSQFLALNLAAGQWSW